MLQTQILSLVSTNLQSLVASEIHFIPVLKLDTCLYHHLRYADFMKMIYKVFLLERSYVSLQHMISLFHLLKMKMNTFVSSTLTKLEGL